MKKASPNLTIGGIARIRGALTELRTRPAMLNIATKEELSKLKVATELVFEVYTSLSKRYYKCPSTE